MVLARHIITSLALCLAAPLAHAFDWPVTARSASRADAIERFRWDRIGAWYAPAQGELRAALAALDASADDGARAHAARAVILRLSQRDDEARGALRRARALSPDGAVLEDPDVALTAAWLAARAGDFAEAASLGAHALARMPPATPQVATHREALVLEVARWSMARGPDGVGDAAQTLRAFAAVAPASPAVRTALALALVRAQRVDEARLLVAPLRDTLQPADGDDLRAPRGSVVRGEAAAATGVALRLLGRPRDAATALARVAEAPAPWRAFIASELAAARRASP